jgi:signal transduction histidine kinase/ActR/RegA family two-component response regulator
MTDHTTNESGMAPALADALQMLAATRDMVLLVDGQTLTLLQANLAAQTQLGYTNEQLAGMPLSDLECALSDMFFWDEMVDRSTASADSAYRCADGSVLDVAKHVIRVSEQPLRYAVSAVVTAQQHDVANELTNMTSRLRATLEATDNGILLIDGEGAILNMNRRFSSLWNIPEELLLNRDDKGVFAHLHDQTATETALEDPAGADMTDAPSVRLHLHDGRVLERSTHIAHSGEELIGRVVSYSDVTERYRSQAQLVAARDEATRASQAKGEFLAMMSHEIRTPMNGVLGIAQLLSDTSLTEEQSSYLRIIRSSGETLLAILNDILDYSKIEAGKLTLERADFVLSILLEEISALFRFRLTPEGPRFECTADADVPSHLRGDSVRLRQILFNLVGNAFKFTERGCISVNVSRVAGSTTLLRFSVRDTGIGIAPDRQAGVFEAFEQADASTNRRFGGTGLGLSICKRLAELMEGEIGLNSTPGEGSEFWFTAKFDVSAQAPRLSATTTSAKAPTVQVLTPSHRVLLVEDNPINRMVMQGMLKRLGGSPPTLAENGLEALEQAQRGVFDVILMDTQMPLMDGIEATRQLRSQGITWPIIGVSAGATDDERLAALNAGMNDYVLKPVGIELLGKALTNALGPREVL